MFFDHHHHNPHEFSKQFKTCRDFLNRRDRYRGHRIVGGWASHLRDNTICDEMLIEEGASTMLLINARNAPRPFRSASASRCTRNVAEPLLIDQAARFIIYYRVRRLVWETGQDKYFVNAWIKSMVIYWLDVIILSSCRKIDRDSKVYPRCVQTAAKVFGLSYKGIFDSRIFNLDKFHRDTQFTRFLLTFLFHIKFKLTFGIFKLVIYLIIIIMKLETFFEKYLYR